MSIQPDPIEFKLQKLREEYKTASVSRRKILTIQAKLLKIAQEKRKTKPATKYTEQEIDDLFSGVK